MKFRIVAMSLVLFAGLATGIHSAAAINFPDRSVSSLTEAPWTAYIRVDTATGYTECTAVLIDPIYVATAAHCLYPVPSVDSVHVFFPDSVEALDASLQDHRVRGIITHQRYSARLSWINDIALIRLLEPINAFRPLKLPPSKDSALLSQAMRIYGYGIDQNLADASSLNTLSVTNRSKEKSKLSGFNSSTMLGVGHYFPKERLYGGACRGDSGGPLVGYSGSTPVLLGIASNVSVNGQYCESRFPSVYTRVSAYLTWLRSSMAAMDQAYDRPNAPWDLRTTSSADGVFVSWSAPTYKGRSEIVQYRLMFYTDLNSVPEFVRLSGTGTTLNGLEAGHNYRFSVSACNAKYCGPYSTEVAYSLTQ